MQSCTCIKEKRENDVIDWIGIRVESVSIYLLSLKLYLPCSCKGRCMLSKIQLNLYLVGIFKAHSQPIEIG